MLTTIALCFVLGASPIERAVRIEVPGHDAVYTLARTAGLAVTDAREDCVFAFADDRAIERVRRLGYCVTVLAQDYQQLAADLVDYHSYAQVCSVTTAQALAHPDICRLETLGLSAGSRPIPAMKVTLHPQVESDRPCVRLVGAHHGNEKISTEVTLAFMQHLIDGYATSSQVRALVNSREFWVIPVFNPDGHVSNSRYNGAGADLNRDYGYEWEVYSSPFRQPETRALMRHGLAQFPTLEYAYHSTASYVNYAWDHTPVDPPDSNWIVALSQRYADSTYGSNLTRLVPINGYNWYEVHGSCQDYTLGALGGLAWTIETQQPGSNRVRIDSICTANRRALLDMSTLAGWGIRGMVYDSATGRPLFARVEFTNPRRWNTYANPTTGGFGKMLAPGVYTVRISSNGYHPRTFADVVVPDTGAAVLDVPMTMPTQEPPNFAQLISTVRRTDDNHVLPGVPPDALGEPDGRAYRIGPGNVEFLLDPAVPCRNRPGEDITVHATGTYSVHVASDPFGPWTSLGSGTNTQSFDLGVAGLDSARYLRVTESSSCLLDAVAYVGSARAGAVEQEPLAALPGFRTLPNPVRVGRVTIEPAGQAAEMFSAQISVSVYDAAGRVVQRSAPHVPRSGVVLDLRGLSPGVYVLRLSAGRATATQKLIISR